MKIYPACAGISIAFLVMMGFGQGCTMVQPSNPALTSRREVEKEIYNPYLGEPLVPDFLAACDQIARDMVLATVFQTASKPVVVEIKPIQNSTSVGIDCSIYPETIRGKVVESGFSKIAFRDEQARKQIINERADGSVEPFVVNDQVGQSNSARQPIGPPRDGQLLEGSRADSQRAMSRTVEAGGQIASVDYFLNGKIYAQSETSLPDGDRGYRYFQFQFRLTDARTGLIVWEKNYRVKREGTLPSRS